MQQSDIEPIRTPRLELIAVSRPFVAALVAGDIRAARDALGVRIGPWFSTDPSHIVQLQLAGIAASAVGLSGLGRIILVRHGRGFRKAIGSIGVHGPPDDGGRLEVGCRIHPSCRDQGYAAEALRALLDWTTARFGVTRFLVAVPSRREPRDLVPIEISRELASSHADPIDELAELVELERP
jgi:RimJ/RimL family protein N-acetyltransferase